MDPLGGLGKGLDPEALRFQKACSSEVLGLNAQRFSFYRVEKIWAQACIEGFKHLELFAQGCDFAGLLIWRFPNASFLFGSYLY